ncbi:hypothetical protein [Sinomonas susongensis]|uniref:hypothetical protein n=1 Tax=Sinomonas susongensis TaxID=1324851 RepID=UPI0011086123|nr:hypothetical protein [Sinomonas susongensis]
MQKLTLAELGAEDVELLPRRETLFWNFNAALVGATNSSLALNVATICSQANSAALQQIVVSQH